MASSPSAAASLSLPAGFTTYVDNTAGFSIGYPQDWTQGTGHGALVFFSAPTKSGDTFGSNVNVLQQAIPASMSLDDYTNQSMQSAGTVVQNFTVDSQGSTTLSGLPAEAAAYSGTVSGKSLKFYAEWTVTGDGSAWVVTYTAAPDGYDKDLSTAQDIMSTFQLS